MHWLRSSLLAFITLVTFQISAAQTGVWFKVPTDKPEHYFHTIDYQVTPLTYPDVNHLFTSPREYLNLSLLSDGPELTGGQFLHIQTLNVTESSELVIDFSFSTYVSMFWHRVYDASGHLVFSTSGGLQSSITNTYFLRHGRDVLLGSGDYIVVSEFAAPFFIAQPQPVLLSKPKYIAAIKPTNFLAVAGVGLFFGLGLYYLVMGLIRRRAIDSIYAGFILSNLIFNSATLLIFSDVFSTTWFYLASASISISNILYVMFVMRLLDINVSNNKWLAYLGLTCITVMSLLLLHSYLIEPSSSNENNRIGVLMFALFGLVAALIKSFDKQHKVTARLYLAANIGFLGPAIVATVFPKLWSADTTYASHWGILAVIIEVILLSFLLSFQLSRVHKERNDALLQARRALKLAKTDKLTAIPNRLAMEEALDKAPQDTCFVFIDLDGVKAFNDKYGHGMGDGLLKTFALVLEQKCLPGMQVFRMGGDEFTLVLTNALSEHVPEFLQRVQTQVANIGYENISVSFGMASLAEVKTDREMIQLADSRMYDHKQNKKLHQTV